MTAPNLENVVETSVDSLIYYLSLKLKNFLLLTSFCSATYLESLVIWDIYAIFVKEMAD